MKSALALGTAAALCAALTQQGAAQAAGVTARAAGGGIRASSQQDGAGDFIVRCFFNNNVAHQDPIEAPGSPNTEHLHVFFGNIAGGGAAGDGTPFPNMQSGDPGTTGTAATMEQNQLRTPTNCQDTKDTASYWIPAPYMVDSANNAIPWQNTKGCVTGCNATGSNKNFHMRVYYIPNGNQVPAEIPDGTVMIAGFPTGCTTVMTGQPPDGCSGGTNYPMDMNIVEYACGANSGGDFDTPLSAWPYDCTNFVNPNATKDRDDGYSDGEVAIVRFPYCWNGQSSFPAPNSPASAPVMVPGYVAPWIPYKAWQHYGLSQRPTNDFAYPDGNGNCTQGTYTHQVVQLEERIHLLTYGAGWGAPSSCTGDTGLNWNSLDNAENANNPNDTNDPANNLVGDGETPSDATVSLGNGVYGPFKCVNALAPNPAPGATTLSFACSNGGDPNCSLGLRSSGSPTGCVSPGGTCYVGRYQPTARNPSYGWETLHADYWQTWQEAANGNANLDKNMGGDFAADVGTFGDVVEDCASGPTGSGSTKCTPSFIVTSQSSPSLVYRGG